MKKYKKLAFSVVFLSYILIFSAIMLSSGVSIVKAENDSDLSNSNVGPKYSNATIISDGYNGIYWNNGTSGSPSITTDKQGGIHVVWDDATNGTWGTDREIMYSSYTKTTGWSYPLVISDGFEGNYWNDGSSYDPKIDMDNEGNIHVVWYDYTNGTWGSESEIMYTKFTPDIGWSNVSVISDGFQGSYWNDGYSSSPTLDVDSQGGVHVAWYDPKDSLNKPKLLEFATFWENWLEKLSS